MRDGVPHGKETQVSSDDSHSAGEYREGKRHGKWISSSVRGGRIEAEWHRGKRHGNWREEGVAGFRSEGEYRDHKRHGKWTKTFSNGGSMATGPGRNRVFSAVSFAYLAAVPDDDATLAPGSAVKRLLISSARQEMIQDR